jgi:putative transposase
MKKSKFTEEQIVGILRETDRDSVSTVAKRHGVSEQAIYTWKKRFGSFQPDDVRRLKQLEQENARLRSLEGENAQLKKLLAEAHLDNAALKDLLTKMYDLPRPGKGRGRSDDGSVA